MSSAALTKQRLEEFVTTFDNPEISAMDRISRILQELPDEAARLRVMRWSFSRFSSEFKRPLVDAPAASVPVNATPTPVLVMPRAVENRPVEDTAADFNRQVAELKNFFGEV